MTNNMSKYVRSATRKKILMLVYNIPIQNINEIVS